MKLRAAAARIELPAVSSPFKLCQLYCITVLCGNAVLQDFVLELFDECPGNFFTHAASPFVAQRTILSTFRVFRDTQDISIGVFEPGDSGPRGRGPDPGVILFQEAIVLEVDSGCFQGVDDGFYIGNLPA